MLGEVDVTPGVTVVTLHGDLDLNTLVGLRELLDQVTAAAGQRIVVDLGDVSFVDVASLSTLLATADALRDEGRSLTVRSASASLRRICALLNAEDILAPVVPAPRSQLKAG